MSMPRSDEWDADALGTNEAIKWCIAHLMAEHCRQSADPQARAAELFDSAKALAGLADKYGPDDESREAAVVRRGREVQHQTLDALHRDTLHALAGLLYPPPRGASGGQ